MDISVYSSFNHRSAGEADSLLLELPATPDQVRVARGHVAEFTHRHSWTQDDADALLLAVGEACNNAVNYGGKGTSEPRMIVSCRKLAEGSLQVEVCNQGNGFHPDLEQMRQLPQDDFSTHGRGFGLMQALVDRVQVLSDGRNTTVRLTKSKSA